jgi:hypothetical protein
MKIARCCNELGRTSHVMREPILLLLLILLVASCQHPQPASSWAGSRKSERIALMEMFPQLSAEDALRIYPDVDEMLVRALWPITLDQAVTRLLDDMDDAEKKAVRDTKKEDLILFHHGLGTGIRNEFGLWRGNTNLLADCHSENPDGASMVIINAVWQRLQNQ